MRRVLSDPKMCSCSLDLHSGHCISGFAAFVRTVLVSGGIATATGSERHRRKCGAW